MKTRTGIITVQQRPNHRAVEYCHLPWECMLRLAKYTLKHCCGSSWHAVPWQWSPVTETCRALGGPTSLRKPSLQIISSQSSQTKTSVLPLARKHAGTALLRQDAKKPQMGLKREPLSCSCLPQHEQRVSHLPSECTYDAEMHQSLQCIEQKAIKAM